APLFAARRTLRRHWSPVRRAPCPHPGLARPDPSPIEAAAGELEPMAPLPLELRGEACHAVASAQDRGRDGRAGWPPVRRGVVAAAPATVSLSIAHRLCRCFRADPGSTLAHPSRWLPFANRSSSAMLDPKDFLAQLSSETFLGEFMPVSSSPTV